MGRPGPELSVVASVYQGSQSIQPFYEQVVAAVRATGLSYEIVLVDDGSRDDSFPKLRELQKADPAHLRVFSLSRNFGHHAAVAAALERCRGELVFLLDSDLQDDPALLSEFLSLMKSKQVDVVYGYQEHRRGGLFERLSGGAFWWLFSKLSGFQIGQSPRTIRVMTRRYVDAVVALGEVHRFTAGLMAWVGFRQHGVPIVPKERKFGRSTYSLKRKVNLLLDAIISFSARPLTLATQGGFAITGLGLLYGTYIVGLKLLAPSSIMAGWSSVLAAILVIGGLNITLTGAVGLYVAKTYEQVKLRPKFVIMDAVDETPAAIAEEVRGGREVHAQAVVAPPG
jgi:putative glycosyltransferase